MATWKEIRKVYGEIKAKEKSAWKICSRWFPIRFVAGRLDYNQICYVGVEWGRIVREWMSLEPLVCGIALYSPYGRITLSWASPIFRFRKEVFRGQKENTND